MCLQKKEITKRVRLGFEPGGLLVVCRPKQKKRNKEESVWLCIGLRGPKGVGVHLVCFESRVTIN